MARADARDRPRDQAVPIPRHHLLIAVAVTSLVIAVVLVLPRLPGARPDPWERVQGLEGPLRVAIGIVRDGVPPMRIRVGPSSPGPRVSVTERYPADPAAAPQIEVGPVKGPLRLGDLPPCRGGALVVATVSISTRTLAEAQDLRVRIHPGTRAERGAGVNSRAGTGRQGPLCTVVGFHQVPRL